MDRLDLGRAAHNPGVVQQLIEPVFGHARHPANIEAVKGLFDTGPFVFDHLPADPRLKYAARHLRQPTVIGNCGQRIGIQHRGHIRQHRRLPAFAVCRDGQDLLVAAHVYPPFVGDCDSGRARQVMKAFIERDRSRR